MRRTAYYTATDDRDAGKLFLLTEMPASQAEMWAAHAFFAMANNGIEVPGDLRESGMAGLARFALQMLGKLKFEDAQPLLDEMLTCVQFVPDPANRNFVRKLVETDIDEIRTRLKLRMEVFKLHSDFFQAAAPSTSA